LANAGASVQVASRRRERAEAVSKRISEASPDAQLRPFATASEEGLRASLAGSQVVFAAGAYGIQLLPAAIRNECQDVEVAIDLNAVPPLGIEGVELTDKAAERDGVVCYGAIGVGGLKMKIHKAAVAQLFERNDQILDAEEVYSIGKKLA
jgi:hypothetical protein